MKRRYNPTMQIIKATEAIDQPVATETETETIVLISPIRIERWIDDIAYLEAPTDKDAKRISAFIQTHKVDLTEYMDPELAELVPSLDLKVMRARRAGVSSIVLAAIAEIVIPDAAELLRDYLTGQYSDGWGEALEQVAMDDGSYLKVWYAHDDYDPWTLEIIN